MDTEFEDGLDFQSEDELPESESVLKRVFRFVFTLFVPTVVTVVFFFALSLYLVERSHSVIFEDKPVEPEKPIISQAEQADESKQSPQSNRGRRAESGRFTSDYYSFRYTPAMFTTRAK